MDSFSDIQNTPFNQEIIDRQIYVLLTYELQRKKMYKIAQRVIILVSNFGVQYLFSLLTYGFDIICGDIQANVKIKDVRKILGITILQFQNDNGFTSVILKFFDSLHDFPRRTLGFLSYYISFPLTLVATQSKHSLTAKRFLLSELMPELNKHPEVRIPFTFQWIFRDIKIDLSTLPSTLFDPIDPEYENEELDLIDQDSDLDFDIQTDEDEEQKNQNSTNSEIKEEINEEVSENQKNLEETEKSKKKITFLNVDSNKSHFNKPIQNPTDDEVKNDTSQDELKSSKNKDESLEQINSNDQFHFSYKPSKIKSFSLYSVFEEYDESGIDVLDPFFLSDFFASFSPTISFALFIVTICQEKFHFLEKFEGNFEIFAEFVKEKSFDEIIWDFDIPELSTVKSDKGLTFIYHFLLHFSNKKKLEMASILSEKWVNKDSQYNLVSFATQLNDIELFFSDSKLSSSNYWSSESFVYCIFSESGIKEGLSVFSISPIQNKAGITLLSLFRIKEKIIDRFDALCDSLIAPFFEMIELYKSSDLTKAMVDKSSSSPYSVKNLLDDLWSEDYESMVNICLKFSSQSFPLIFLATPIKYQHYLYESKYVNFSTECALYSSNNKMIQFKNFLKKRIDSFEDIAQNMTYNFESISDEILNDFFEFSLIHFAEISKQCRNIIFTFYNKIKKIRPNCREFDFSYKVKYATDFLKFEASRRFEGYMNSEINVKKLTDIIEKQKGTNQNLFEYMIAVLISEIKFIESHDDQENQKIITALIELIKREIIDSNQINNIFSLIVSMLSDPSKTKYNFSILFIEKSIQFLGDHTFFASQLLLNDNLKKKSPTLYSKIDSIVKTFTFQNFSDFFPEIEIHPHIKKFSNVVIPPQKKIKSLQSSFTNLSLIPKSIEKYIEFSDWIATVLVKKYLESPTILPSLINVVFSSPGQFDSLFVQCCIYRFFSIMGEKDFDKGNLNGYLLRRNVCLLGQLIGLLTLSNNNPKNLRFLKIKDLISYALSNGKLYGVVGFISALLMQCSPYFFPPNPFTSSILGYLASISIIQNLKSHIKNQIETLFEFFNVSIDDFNLSESDSLFPDKLNDNFDFNSDLFNLSSLFSENQMKRIISFDQNFYFCLISYCLILPKLKIILPSIPSVANVDKKGDNSDQSKKKRRYSSSPNYSSLFTSQTSNSSSSIIKEFNSQDRIRIIWDIFSLIKQFSQKLSKIIVSTVSSTILKDLTDKSSFLITAKNATKKLASSLVSQISFFDYEYIFSNYLSNVTFDINSNNYTKSSKLPFQQKILNELKKIMIDENSFWIHQFLNEVTFALSFSQIKEQIENTKINFRYKTNPELINLMKYVLPNQILQLDLPPPLSSTPRETNTEDKNIFIYNLNEDNEVCDDDKIMDHLDQNLFDYLCKLDQACTLEVMKGHKSFKELDNSSIAIFLLSQVPEIESQKAALQTFFVFLDANSFLLLLEALVFLIRKIFGSSNLENESIINETNDDSELFYAKENKGFSTPNRNQPTKRFNNVQNVESEDENANENLQSFACLLLRKFILPPLAIQELISLNILTTSSVDTLFASILDNYDCNYIYERQLEMIVSFLSYYIVEFPHFSPQDFIKSFTVCSFLPLFQCISNQSNPKLTKMYNQYYQQATPYAIQSNKTNLKTTNNIYNTYANNYILMKKVFRIHKIYFEFSTAPNYQNKRKTDLYDNFEYTSLFTKWKNTIRATNEAQIIALTKTCSKMPQDFFFSIFEKESIDDIIKFLRCIDKVCEIKSIQQNIYTAIITIASAKQKNLYKKIYEIIKSLQKFQTLNNTSLPSLLHQLRPLKHAEFTFLWISLISDPRFIVNNIQNEASVTTSATAKNNNEIDNNNANANNGNSGAASNDINGSSSPSNDKEFAAETRTPSSAATHNIDSIGYAPLYADFAATVGFLIDSHDPFIFQIVYKAFLRLTLVLSHDFPDFIASIAVTSVSLLPPEFTQIRNILLSVAPRTILPTSSFTPDMKIDHMSDVHQTAFNLMPLSLPPKVQKSLEIALNLFSNLVMPNFASFSHTIYSSSSGLSGWNSNSNASANSPLPFNLRNDIEFLVKTVKERPQLLAVFVEETFNITVCNDTFTTVSSSSNSNSVPQRPPFLNSGAFRLFETILTNAQDELVVAFIDCFVDQLRFRCRNTHFFSKMLIELFKMNLQTKSGASLSEIIAIAILKRCSLQPPHPWGLAVTVIELLSNKEIGFWEFPFTKSSSFACVIQTGNPSLSFGNNELTSSDKVTLFLKSIYFLFCNSNNL